MKYIHFGSPCFDRGRFVPIRNIPFRNKPDGGLWASADNAEYGWYDWSRDNDDFGHCRLTNSFSFTLNPVARILTLKTKEDVLRAANIGHSSYFGDLICLDFEALAQAYDVIDFYIAQLYMNMYGWDCDSILVMNPDVIKEVRRS